jgi:hypothetical protein
MLKRTIFLLSYFAFLILAPIAVYYFWPVETEYVSPPDMEMMVDPDIPNANEELEDVVNDFNDSLSAMARGIYAFWAILLCFLVSLVVAFAISIWKFCRPQKKLGGIVVGILIFNAVYIPFYVIVLCFIVPVLGYYLFFGLGRLLPDIIPALYIVLGLFIFTIAFLTGAMIRAAKIPSPMPSPYDLPENREDNSTLTN